MTATIAIELGEVPNGTPHYYSLFAIGTVLFLISLLINITAERIAARFRHLT
jgi:phosphate transport system permease protein